MNLIEKSIVYVDALDAFAYVHYFDAFRRGNTRNVFDNDRQKDHGIMQNLIVSQIVETAPDHAQSQVASPMLAKLHYTILSYFRMLPDELPSPARLFQHGTTQNSGNPCYSACSCSALRCAFLAKEM